MRIQGLALLVLAGCGPSNPVNTNPDIALPIADLSRESQDIVMVPQATTAAVTTSSFMMGGTGTLATVGLADKRVTKNIDATLDQDNAVRFSQGKLLVLDHTHGAVRVYDPAKQFMNPVEIKTGALNPHDAIALPASSKVYVTLYDAKADSAVAILDTAQPAMGVVKSIAIPMNMADTDMIPEANDLYLCGQYAYVTTQDLDRNKMYAPAGNGRIVAIDTTKDMVDGAMGEIALMGENPNGFAAEGTGCDLVLTADSSNQFGAVAGKGGIERVDLTARKSKGMVLTDTALMGHPNTIAVRSKTLAFTVLTVNNGAGQSLVSIDPQAGKLGGAVLPQAGFIPFAQVSPDGQLFVGVAFSDGMTMKPDTGLYVGPADGTMLPTTPIDLGQAPYSIAFF
jgi:hypothetical protein